MSVRARSRPATATAEGRTLHLEGAAWPSIRLWPIRIRMVDDLLWRQRVYGRWASVRAPWTGRGGRGRGFWQAYCERFRSPAPRRGAAVSLSRPRAVYAETVDAPTQNARSRSASRRPCRVVRHMAPITGICVGVKGSNELDSTINVEHLLRGQRVSTVPVPSLVVHIGYKRRPREGSGCH